MVSRTAQAIVNRDKNALRGLYLNSPGAKTMADIHLAAGEDMYAAVMQMVEAGELESCRTDGKITYSSTQYLKAYRPT